MMLRAAFTKYPILMNSIFYGSLYVGAEFSQQTVTRKLLAQDNVHLKYDWLHLGRYFIIGSTALSPTLTICDLKYVIRICCHGMQHQGQPTAYDPYKITRFGILGVTLYPPIYYYWYKWLDKKFVEKTFKVITKKLILDQFLLTPPLLVMFYVGMSILEGKKDIFEDCRKKFVTTFEKSCMFWLPAQTINFMFIPPTFRVVYIGSCAFIWVNILCFIKRQKN